MGELGALLRAKRDELGRTLAEVESTTHIRQKYLVALEDENFSVFSDAVRARGFLRVYARYLGLDVPDLLSRFDSALPKTQTLPNIPQNPTGLGPVDFSLRLDERPNWGRRILSWLSIMFVVALIAGGIWLWQTGQLADVVTSARAAVPFWPKATSTATVTPSPTASTVPAPAILPTATTTVTGGPTATPQPTTLPASNATATPSPTTTPTRRSQMVTVQIDATDTVWLRVIVDSQPAQEMTIQPGESRSWTGEQVSLRLGNAGGVHLFLNGQDEGVPGKKGQVVQFVWTMRNNQIVRLTPKATTTP